MNRFVGILVIAIVLGWTSFAQAQVYTTYYAPPVVTPVTTYYAPSTVYYAPPTTYIAPAPRVTYVAPSGYYTYRPILGGWRYNPAPVVVRYPVTTAYYPAY
jgi:hypothetical protein